MIHSGLGQRRVRKLAQLSQRDVGICQPQLSEFAQRRRQVLEPGTSASASIASICVSAASAVFCWFAISAFTSLLTSLRIGLDDSDVFRAKKCAMRTH